MIHRAPSRPPLLPVVMAAALLPMFAACEGDDDPSRSSPSTVPDGTPVSAGIRLVEASGFGASPWTTDQGDCESRHGEIVLAGSDARIGVATWGPGCVETEGLNGRRVRYNTLADVLDLTVLATEAVPAGTANLFEQDYTECTNECTSWVDRIVLVELDQPVDPAFPTVMISTIDDVASDELLAVAAALRIDPAA